MRDIEQLLRTISSIYSVPGNPDGWSDAVGDIAGTTGAVAGAYMLVSTADQEMRVAGYSGYSKAQVLAYEGPNSAAKDIRFQYAGNLVPGVVFREFEFVPDRAAYDASEWIQYALAANGTYWCMSAHVSTHGLWHDFISVNRLYERGPHTDDEKADLQALLPHLSRAAELHQTMTSLQRRYGAVLGVLDKLLVGLVILDLKGRVAVANAAARSSCEESGALLLGSEGRLCAWQGPRDLQLQALISSTSRTADARGLSDGGSLVLAKRTTPGYLLLEVIPIRDDGFSDSDQLAGTGVFIIDPEISQRISLEGLARIFELTPTEHAVATALLNGVPPRQIAEERNNSVETIRSHIKKVFAKTRTRSQLELMRLAVKANPPIDHP